MHKIVLLPLSGDVEPAVRALGWDWAVADACAHYVAREAVKLPEKEADALLDAASALYQLCVESIPDPIPDDLLHRLAIPENLWEAVRHSWDDDRHWHLYGRFDLALTPDGPKLLEFNADTATSIPETAVVQWASLKAAGLSDDDRQANGLYEGLTAQLREWRERNPDLDPHLLLVHLPDSAEDETNCAVLAAAALDAGFTTAHVTAVDEMTVAADGDDLGVWAAVETDQWQRFDFVFKLVPWEVLAEEEPELTADLTQLLLAREVVVANPAYALLFQSKGLLAWLWEQYPHHPLLLETTVGPLEGHAVSKPLFGREGQNVAELEDGQVVDEVPGEYGQQRYITQRWAEMPSDPTGRRYQAGVFWAGEGCAIGFRRAQGIITNLSEFVPHVLA